MPHKLKNAFITKIFWKYPQKNSNKNIYLTLYIIYNKFYDSTKKIYFFGIVWYVKFISTEESIPQNLPL